MSGTTQKVVTVFALVLHNDQTGKCGGLIRGGVVVGIIFYFCQQLYTYTVEKEMYCIEILAPQIAYFL